MKRLSPISIVSLVIIVAALGVFIYLVILLPALDRIAEEAAEPSTQEPQEPEIVLSSRIVFVSDRDGNYEIYTMNPDGSDQVRLTNNSEQDADPQWSPDGRQIAYLSTSPTALKQDLYTMNADGSDQHPVLEANLQVYDFAWSPDGTQIAFIGAAPDDSSGLYVIDVGGGAPVLVLKDAWGPPVWSPDGMQLAVTVNTPKMGAMVPEIRVTDLSGNVTALAGRDESTLNPAWSPDGSLMAFIANPDPVTTFGNIMVCLAKCETGAVSSLPGAYYQHLAWSPDGLRLAYMVMESNSSGALWVARLKSPDNPALLDPVVLSPTGEAGSLDWSPDGAQIVFDSQDAQANYVFYIASATPNGSSVTRLTDLSSSNLMPDWGPEIETVVYPDVTDEAPTGEPPTDEPPTLEPPTNEPPTDEPPPGALGRIVFVSDRDGNDEIYTMNPDGTDPVRLTDNEAVDSQPVWSPDGSKIAFISYEDGMYNLVSMNADGGGQTRLAEGVTISAVRWSPDSSQIAWIDSGLSLNAISAGGGMQTLIAQKQVSDKFVAWGPGGALAFVRLMDAMTGMMGSEVHVLLPDGNEPIRISPEGIVAELPAWSPDGTRLAFATMPDPSTGGHLIYVADLSNSAIEPQLLTPNTMVLGDLEWSPDGAWLAFTALHADGYNEVYIVPAEGGNMTRLAEVTGPPDLVWSPDSTQLLLVSKSTAPAPDGPLAIVRVLLDGSGVYPVTTPNSNNAWPDW